ncbi:type VI secretion system-associated FHA domain protein TagH [Kangiella sp.]|uniref:type VI secretion system-associated FHA domain protein TagH n=1 Tax=Kangiella sp. TaxID=1920245 RepID=UPI0019971542|nr:type VI secretion system-associated FHA domain protein TagH [Kangiella sp.]MBD3653158.1 type VI secretion system-associated FHA domain protein TagH [Kangiella sp.]
MKQLTLRITSFHRLAPDQVATKTFDRIGGVIGRSADADWVLPDPEKIVSSTHAVISFEAGSYSITDYSTNGLFINRGVEPLGKGQTRMLQDGDYLQVGEYEIEVTLEDNQVTGHDSSLSRDQQPVASPVGSSSPLEPEPVYTGAAGFEHQQMTNPLNESYSAPSLKQAQPEVVPSEVSAATAQAAAQQIPDDWDPGLVSIQSKGQQSAEVQNQQQQVVEHSQVSQQTTTQLAANADTAQAVQPHLQTQPQSQSQSQVQAQPQPQTQPQAQAGLTNSQPITAGAGAEVCLNELLKGLGLSAEEIQLNNQPEFYHRLGAALRLSLQGMLDILRARASMKSEFRVMQTTIRTQENNPLKFSINVDEAIRNLFARRIPGFLSWDQAIQECFKDMSSHELALMAGTEGAVNAVLSQLNPDHFVSDEQQSNSIEKWIPVAKKAKSWDKYKEQYKKVNEELGQGSGKRFSEEFAEAYEAQLTALGVR